MLHIESDTSLPTARLIRCMELLKELRGLPRMIRVDNEPELVSARLDNWCREHQITLIYTTWKANPKRLFRAVQWHYTSRTFKTYLFQTLNEVSQKAEEWKRDYNEQKPHKSPGSVPPAEYKAIS